jgi:hypothetical protein
LEASPVDSPRRGRARGCGPCIRTPAARPVPPRQPVAPRIAAVHAWSCARPAAHLALDLSRSPARAAAPSPGVAWPWRWSGLVGKLPWPRRFCRSRLRPRRPCAFARAARAGRAWHASRTPCGRNPLCSPIHWVAARSNMSRRTGRDIEHQVGGIESRSRTTRSSP